MSIEPLAGAIFACSDEKTGFGVDAFLLARFAAPNQDEHALDLCAGCGIVSLLWARDSACQSITALELLPKAAVLAQKSVRLSKLEDYISVICADLRDYETLFPPSCFDLIAVNPPFYQNDTGTISPNSERALARSELTATLSDICKAAAYLLKDNGRLIVCNHPTRTEELKTLLHVVEIVPIRQQFIRHDPAKRPFLVLIEGKKGGGDLKIFPDLNLYRGGKPTLEYLSLYEKK